MMMKLKKMMRDAESHAEDDRNKKQLAEVRNEADTLVYSVEKSLRDYGNKLSEPEEEGDRRDARKVQEGKRLKYRCFRDKIFS